MKVHTVACVLASVTGIVAGAEDWKDRRLKQRSSLDASQYATEVSGSLLPHLLETRFLRLSRIHRIAPPCQDETLKAVLEYDAKRARMLKDRLEHHERRLEEHVSGRRLLKDDEHERTLRQINVVAQHLGKLESETHDEKMEKVDDARRSMYNMHRNDYLDYGKTGLN
jgi:hypothetical protein